MDFFELFFFRKIACFFFRFIYKLRQNSRGHAIFTITFSLFQEMLFFFKYEHYKNSKFSIIGHSMMIIINVIIDPARDLNIPHKTRVYSQTIPAYIRAF